MSKTIKATVYVKGFKGDSGAGWAYHFSDARFGYGPCPAKDQLIAEMHAVINVIKAFDGKVLLIRTLDVDVANAINGEFSKSDGKKIVGEFVEKQGRHGTFRWCHNHANMAAYTSKSGIYTSPKSFRGGKLIGTFTLEEVLPYIGVGGNKTYHDFSGYKVKTSTPRMRTLKDSQICACCGLGGIKFKLAIIGGFPHMDLYGERNGHLVMLTMDHIIPRCEGGRAIKENLQTLCADCNGRKGSKLITIEELRKLIGAA